MVVNKPRAGIYLFLLLACMVIEGFATGCRNQASTERVYTVGIVSGFEAFSGIADGFKDGMATLGYLEGRDVVYDQQHINPDREADKQAIRTLIEKKVDLILTYPTEASLLTKELARDTGIPIVFAMAGIEGNSLVDSIQQPGGHITGVRYSGPDLIVKRFELLQELMPDIQRIWTAYDLLYPTNKASIAMLRQGVAASGVTLLEALVTTPEEIQADLQTRVTAGKTDIDAIMMMPDAVSQSPAGWAVISRFAAAYKIPIVGTGGKAYDADTVISYTPDIFDMGRQAATLADKILQGTPAGTIMVTTAQARLRLNYHLAQKQGLTVPKGLLSKADEIIR